MTKHISPRGIEVAREFLMKSLENGDNLSDDAVSGALYGALEHVYDSDDVDQLATRTDLRDFHRKVQLRDDWHEPSERDITATVVGEKFDNSDTEVENVYHHFGDMAVVLWRTEEDEDSTTGQTRFTKPLAVVNLCDLLAWATEDERSNSNRVRVQICDDFVDVDGAVYRDDDDEDD